MILSWYYLVCLFNIICLAISFCESVSSYLYAFSHTYNRGIVGGYYYSPMAGERLQANAMLLLRNLRLSYLHKAVQVDSSGWG